MSPVASGNLKQVDPALVRKYSVPGPRYTSYPTAPHFRDDLDPEILVGEPDASAVPANHPLSLYFHLPFCESRCWFCGCTTVITRNHGMADTYLDFLEKEIELIQPSLREDRPVVQIHWGGGTPTFLSPHQIRRLGGIIHRHFRISNDAEFAVEIDPRRLEKDHILALRDIGANRASLGVQDHNPEVQQAVNRIQPLELTEQTMNWLREAGFRSINIDLIYGLPAQTPESMDRTLDEVLATGPSRLAVFSYAHVPWIKPAQKILEKRSRLPDAEEKIALFCGIVDKVTERGFVNIGMDHFALPDDELAVAQREGKLQRNFQGYSVAGGTDIRGFGMSAISQSAQAYRQNEKELDRYYGSIREGRLPLIRGYILNHEDRIRRETIMRLMCDMRLHFRAMSARLGVQFEKHFEAELSSLRDLEDDGLLHRSDEGIEISAIGRLLIRNVAMRFDAYLKDGPKTFSKTV